MRGRKPKPTFLKVVTGNPGRRPINDREASPAVALPSPPDELNADGRIEWDRVAGELYRVGLLTGVDRGVLAAYSQAYGRWIQAERVIAEMGRRDALTHGLMIKTSNGNPIQNPLVGTANKAMADMVRYAAELGMTPSARSRVRANDEPYGKDPAEDYFA